MKKYNYTSTKKYILKIIKISSYVVLITLSLFLIFNVFIKNYDLTIAGRIKYADGIGRQTIDLINMLELEPISINFIGKVKSRIDLNDRVKSVIGNINFKIGHVFINEEPLSHNLDKKHNFKKLLQHFLSKINAVPREKQIGLAYSMFESNKINQVWVYELNTKYDAVIVPDENLVSIYKDSGVNIPIFVVPLSVDFNGALEQPIKSSLNSIFTFANFSAIEDRKNTLKLLEAFNAAFGNRSDVRLLINASRYDKLYNVKVSNYILEHNLTNVDYNVTEKNAELYNQYFNLADCYVSLSKGEGFSIQPREAMARGIPVIVSDSIAQNTIANSGLVKVVPNKIAKVATYFDNSIMIGNNFDIELSDAIEALKDVYNNYQYYLNLAPKAREWAAQYSYDNIRPLYINLVKPRKVVLGKENKITKEYLETNSEELYTKYNNLIKK